jgi:hypothetical protein
MLARSGLANRKAPSAKATAILSPVVTGTNHKRQRMGHCIVHCHCVQSRGDLPGPFVGSGDGAGVAVVDGSFLSVSGNCNPIAGSVTGLLLAFAMLQCTYRSNPPVARRWAQAILTASPEMTEAEWHKAYAEDEEFRELAIESLVYGLVCDHDVQSGAIPTVGEPGEPIRWRLPETCDPDLPGKQNLGRKTRQ